MIVIIVYVKRGKGSDRVRMFKGIFVYMFAEKGGQNRVLEKHN